MSRRVNCITEENGTITHIGGPADGGWKLSKALAVSEINSAKNFDPDAVAFYVQECETKTEVIATSDGHLKTVSDGVAANNLDNLKSCT